MLRATLSTILPAVVIDIILEYAPRFQGKVRGSYHTVNHVQAMTIIQEANGKDTTQLLIANGEFFLSDAEHFCECTFFASYSGYRVFGQRYPVSFEVKCMVAWLGLNQNLFLVWNHWDRQNLLISEYKMEGAEKGTLINDSILPVQCDRVISLLTRMPQYEPQSKSLIALGWDNGFKVFDLDKKVCLWSNNEPIANLQWIRDEASIVPTLRYGSDNSIVQWNPVTRERKILIDTKADRIVCFSFRSDGQQCGIGIRRRFADGESQDRFQLWEHQECKWQHNPNVFRHPILTSDSRVCFWVKDVFVAFEYIGSVLVALLAEKCTTVQLNHPYAKSCLVWNHEKLLLYNSKYLSLLVVE